jgi:mono/diheme cytochrome c family protein
MFKPLLFVAAIALFGITASFAPGAMPQEAAQPPAAGAVNPVKPTAHSQARARKIYGIDCAMCHGDNGDGKTDLARDMELTLKDWSDPKTLAARPNQELFSIIRSGKGKMPPEAEGRAKDDEVWNLILYIRSRARQRPAAAPTPAAAPVASN